MANSNVGHFLFGYVVVGQHLKSRKDKIISSCKATNLLIAILCQCFLFNNYLG